MVTVTSFVAAGQISNGLVPVVKAIVPSASHEQSVVPSITVTFVL